MKVIIQVPCFNEEKTLPLVFEKMPKSIPGVDILEYQIIDDGSTDKTVEVAKKLGVHHIISRPWQGLGRSFHDGVNNALSLGADIVVNTDGDNQYPSERIADLVQPIIRREADIVIGDRQTQTIEHFSPLKKKLQKIGSSIVNVAANTQIPDAASGFRAYSRHSLLQLNTITRFSYCMETIIQAGNKQLAIQSIPIKTNRKTRESRLFKNMWEHIGKSSMAIIRAYIMYRPYVIFASLSLFFAVLGIIPFLRYVYFALQHEQGAHLQSLLLGSVLLIASFLSMMLGVLADLTRTNRILIENSLEHLKEIRFDKK